MNPTQDPRQARTTTVVITGTVIATGKKVISEIPIPHDAGVPEPLIIDAAIKAIRGMGGLMVQSDDPEAVDFYPLMSIMLTCKCRKIALAVVTH